MVVRTRLRAFLIPLVLYAVSGVAGFYFIWQVQHGQRGLEAKIAFKTELRGLQRDLADLKAERIGWDRRVAMMQTDAVDRDLLEEEARLELGRIQKNEMLVYLPQGRN
jgi:cell division protein FtsB